MAEKVTDKSAEAELGSETSAAVLQEGDIIVNASGHKQELERIFNPWALYGYSVTTGNMWITLGGSIVSLYLKTQASQADRLTLSRL